MFSLILKRRQSNEKNTVPVQYHVQFQGMTEQYKSCFYIKVLHKQWKNVLFLHILQWKSYYVPVHNLSYENFIC
jgi:hypothetical protein